MDGQTRTTACPSCGARISASKATCPVCGLHVQVACSY